MSNRQPKQTHSTLEDVEMEFVADWEDGKSPTLSDYARRYPQFISELTEFVVEFVATENAARRLTESPVVSDEMRLEMNEFLSSVQTPFSDLNQARDAMGWTLSQFAQKIGIGLTLMRRLVRGEIPDASGQKRLLWRLSQVLCRPQCQIVALLQNATPSTPDHFKATGSPGQLLSKPMTWREALLDCQKRGELTPEQVEVWLQKDESE